MTTTKSLLELTAKDLMTESVMVIPQEMSMQGAARRFMEKDVHGAPVVDEGGHCVGVLSTSDFLFLAGAAKKADLQGDGKKNYFSPWQIVSPGDLPEEAVSKHMTPDPVKVTPDTTIAELAEMMLDAHIHRLIVVENEGRPVGIVSCTDILAALARAGKRARQQKEAEVAALSGVDF